MRRHQQTPIAPCQRHLQPLEGRDVEVVGGLVQHEQVGVGHQQPSQGHAGLLAAGQLRRLVVPQVRRDAQPGQRLLHPLVEVVAIGGLEAVAQGGIGRRLHALSPAGLQLGELPFHALHLGGTTAHDGPHVRGPDHARVQVRFLREQLHARALGQVDPAAVRLLVPGDDLQQGRLARTVAADQTHALAARQRGRDRVEDDEVADLATHPIEAEDGHGPSVPAIRAGRVPPPGPRGPTSCGPGAPAVARGARVTGWRPCDRPAAVAGTRSRSACHGR